jgi:MoxR-like ATPase
MTKGSVPDKSLIDRPDNLKELFDHLVWQVGRLLLGKEHQIRLGLCSLIAGGHLLVEDIPGIGKTTLAKVLAQILGLQFQRIQCTNDMLPGDILGVSIFDKVKSSFLFHRGPVFTQILLADEINRTTPKTQSALLEAMEEYQVTVEGKTRQLPKPFFVVATQNPLEHSGTYPLPESQLDRFLFRVSIGYPTREAEHELLLHGGVTGRLVELEPMLTSEQILNIQKTAQKNLLAANIIEYIQDLLSFSRESGTFAIGLSPRAGLSLAKAAQSWSLMEGRDFVLPEDVQAVLPYLAVHRLRRRDTYGELNTEELVQLFATVPIRP